MTNSKTYRVLSLTGDTYRLRRQIKHASGGKCHFDSDRKAWLIPLRLRGKMADQAEKHGLTLAEITVDYDPFPSDREAKRALRQIRRNRKAEQLERLAAMKRARAEKCRTTIATAGYLKQAADLEAKAEWLRETPARVKGDRKRERLAQRAENERLIEVGLAVTTDRRYRYFQKGHVLRIHQISFAVRLEDGSEALWDKAETLLDPTGEPISVEEPKEDKPDPRQIGFGFK